MNVDLSIVSHASSFYYDILVEEKNIKPLIGYDDKNFLLEDKKDGQKYVLKIVNPNFSNKALTGKPDSSSSPSVNLYSTLRANCIAFQT